MRKHVMWTLLGGALIVVLAMWGRALTYGAPVEPAPAVGEPLEVPRDAAAARLSEAVRLPTLSHQDPSRVDGAPFEALRALMDRSYPRAHVALSPELVPPHSLLFTWRGSDPTLEPALLLAHMDVVPVDEGALARWRHDPFSGKIAEGAIWGRGTLDDKYAVLAQLEAVELLLASGFKPKRTVYLAFGYDEEVGGRDGARKIGELLTARGVKRAAFVLDEGLAILEGIVPGIDTPVALIGVAEKGFLTIHLEVEGTGGHSSMPPKQTAVGVLARAVARLEDHPMEAGVDGPLSMMFEQLGAHLPFHYKFIFGNIWLFEPLLITMLEGKVTTNAAVRTTAAATMFEGSPQDNVLPQRARAAVNFRLHPRDSVDRVVAHVERHKGDARVVVLPEREGFGSEPSKVSPARGVGYEAIARSAQQAFPGVLVAPSLMIGATDTRHYIHLSDHIYRFSPLHLRDGDTDRIHGTDERILIEDYERAIRFYIQLMRNMQPE